MTRVSVYRHTLEYRKRSVNVKVDKYVRISVTVAGNGARLQRPKPLNRIERTTQSSHFLERLPPW